MLDIQRPPTSPDHASLSESGIDLVVRALRGNDNFTLFCYGQAAHTEIVDSFGGKDKVDEPLLNLIREKLGEDVRLLETEAVADAHPSIAYVFSNSIMLASAAQAEGAPA